MSRAMHVKEGEGFTAFYAFANDASELDPHSWIDRLIGPRAAGTHFDGEPRQGAWI